MDYSTLHPWKVTLEQAIHIQNNLRGRIETGIGVTRVETVAGADVEYRGGHAFGAVAVLSVPEMELVDQAGACCEINFPYVPGFLSFREGPVLLECFHRLLLDCPAIGCAKNKLFGHAEEPGLQRGSQAWLLDQSGRVIGAALRTREKVKPVYVSPGFKIDLKRSLEIIMACATKYRLPEPLRTAHRLAGLAALEGN